MTKSNIIELKDTLENEFKDTLTDLVRTTAKAAIQEAINAEVTEFINDYKNMKLEDGKQQVVRNGYNPERTITTGIGSVKVKMPKVRDRKKSGISFTSVLIPPYMRRSKSIDELLPLLYLQGISTSKFKDALAPILGNDAKNISANVICKLKEKWFAELDQWRSRDLSNKHYVYWWADGIYIAPKMESDKTCILVIIGATADGGKELVAFNDGFRESTESWLELFRDLKSRGFKEPLKLGIGDGSMGFWSALEKEFPTTKPQRCWVHKIANILNCLPKSLHSHAKSKLKDIYMAENKKSAEKAFKEFIDTYDSKYPKATKCLSKDKEKLLEFYNFPAEHWQHIRSTNPIESTFATIKHRTKQARGCYSKETLLAAFFKLAIQAEKKWHRLNGYKRINEMLNNVTFIDGISEHEVDKIKQDKNYAA